MICKRNPKLLPALIAVLWLGACNQSASTRGWADAGAPDSGQDPSKGEQPEAGTQGAGPTDAPPTDGGDGGKRADASLPPPICEGVYNYDANFLERGCEIIKGQLTVHDLEVPAAQPGVR